MIIDKLESYTLHIDQAAHFFTRRKILKLLAQLKSQFHFNAEFIKVQTYYLLRVDLPKKALPYLISFLSFHNFIFNQIILTKHERKMLSSSKFNSFEKHFDILIDGLSDLFIKDKVIDVLNSFKDREIQYSFSNHVLKVTTEPKTFGLLIQKLATSHIDIYHASLPLRGFQNNVLSC
ncbi:hypothetical protein [Staphylococcus sp. 11261D007BR]